MCNDTSNQPLKRCNVCHENKIQKEFYKDSKNRDGLAALCKKCHAEKYHHKYVPSVPEGQKRCWQCQLIHPATSEYFHKNARTKDGLQATCIECRKKDYQIKREGNIARVTRWAMLNPDKRKKITDKYIRNNKGKVSQLSRANSEKRRSKRNGVIYSFSKTDWINCLEYWGNRCCICGQAPDMWHRLAQDHWIAITNPSFDNPGTVAWNILPMCHSAKGANGMGSCNHSKHHKDGTKWLIEYLGEEQGKQKLAEIEVYFAWVKSQKEIGE